MLPVRGFRGRYKPPGMPRLDMSRLPRGLRACFPFADAHWTSLGPVNNSQPARIGSLVSGSASALGPVLAPNFSGANVNAEISYAADNLVNAASIEVFFVTSSTLANTALAGFNANNDGTSTTQDKALFLNGSSQLQGFIFASGTQSVIDTTTVFAANTPYHVVYTWDGTNQRLYVNGVQTASVAAGTAASFTPFICFGSDTMGPGGGSKDGRNNYLLANYANIAWTAQEVAARYADPYGFLVFPEEDFMAFLVGVIAGGGTTINFLRAAYTYTGNAETTNAATNQTLGRVSYTYTGKPLTVNASTMVALAKAAYTYTGRAFTLNASTMVALTKAAFTYTGQAFTTGSATVINFLKASYGYTGKPFSVLFNLAIAMGRASYSYTGQAFKLGKQLASRALRGVIRGGVILRGAVRNN